MCSVYWLKTPEMTDINTEGYVGMSENPENRFYSHKYNPANCKLMDAFKTHRGRVSMEIIHEGDRKTCSGLEHTLRPTYGIGWNVARGGGSLNAGRGTGVLQDEGAQQLQYDKQRLQYEEQRTQERVERLQKKWLQQQSGGIIFLTFASNERFYLDFPKES
jgi:hypothetical protein